MEMITVTDRLRRPCQLNLGDILNGDFDIFILQLIKGGLEPNMCRNVRNKKKCYLCPLK